MKLYLKYFSIHLRSIMQFKVSFFLTAIGQALTMFFSFLGMYFLFERFNTINGYTFNEVLLCFSTIYISFALAEMFGRGFDTFTAMISNGEFDRIMVRPQNEILQVIGSRIELTRVGRLIQALIIFIFSIMTCDVVWSPEKVFTLLLMIIGGVVLFFSLFMIYAAFCFFTIEGLEFMNIFTDGGREIAQYPLNIYKEWVVKFFTFVVPLAFINYYPFLFLIDQYNGFKAFYMLSPLLTLLFSIPSYLFWKFGVRHYKSTGS